MSKAQKEDLTSIYQLERRFGTNDQKNQGIQAAKNRHQKPVFPDSHPRKSKIYQKMRPQKLKPSSLANSDEVEFDEMLQHRPRGRKDPDNIESFQIQDDEGVSSVLGLNLTDQEVGFIFS